MATIDTMLSSCGIISDFEHTSFTVILLLFVFVLLSSSSSSLLLRSPSSSLSFLFELLLLCHDLSRILCEREKKTRVRVLELVILPCDDDMSNNKI
jgi:hypothetical protein